MSGIAFIERCRECKSIPCACTRTYGLEVPFPELLEYTSLGLTELIDRIEVYLSRVKQIQRLKIEDERKVE